LTPKISIFFDLDGTLTDPRDGVVRCIAYALEQLGSESPEPSELERYIGPPLYESFAALLNSNDAKLLKRAVELYRERFVSTGMFENTIYAGIPDALQKLKNALYKLVVVTSKPTVFARQIIDHFGLERIFHNIYGSELNGVRADKRQLIAHVLEQEQIHPSEAVMVGDREHDLKGALANGVLPVGVLWGYGSREELTQAGALLLCDTPESLAKHFC
jgi:phosphoglycolate phosphatase